MGFVFLLCVFGMYIISKIDHAKGVKANGLEIDASMFKTSRAFTAGALLVGGVIVALYSFFW
jgi:SSS family solute:Na+ symporter